MKKTENSSGGGLGMKLPLSPRARTVVLLRMYWARIDIKVNLIGMGIQMLLGTLSRKGAGSITPGARMVWLQSPATKQTVSVCNHGNEADPHLWSQWSSIIQKGPSPTIPPVTTERTLVYYLTPTTNIRGISTSGPRPNSKDSRSEHRHITVEEIESTLRTGVYLGEAWNIVIRIYRAGDSQIGEMLGGTEYPRLVSCDKRSLLIKFDPENPTPHQR